MAMAPGGHAFADESKRGTYTVAVVTCAPGDLTESRRALRGLLLRGQRRLHFNPERPARRDLILRTICGLPLQVGVYAAPGRPEPAARRAVLERLVPDLVDLRVVRLVLERDESTDRHDRRALFEITGEHKCRDLLHYDLLNAQDDPMLWAADAAAWCWTKGGTWKTRVSGLVEWGVGL